MEDKRYTFTENKITAQVVDQAYDQIWLAYLQDVSGNCALQKRSAFNPSQLYYDIDITVDMINKMIIDGAYLYLAYNDSTLIGARYAVNNPLTSFTEFSLPSGITEAPVDLLVSGSDLWYLTPGSGSGENAKLIKMGLTGIFDEIVDLIETGNAVTDAISLTEDSISGDLYIVTNTSPANLVRVYQNTGGSYEFEITPLTP